MEKVVTYECDRDSVFQGRNGRPLPCALLACAVLDLWEEVFAIAVFEFENIGCDFNQERVQLCLIPFLKYLEGEKKSVHTHIYLHIDLLSICYINRIIDLCIHRHIYTYRMGS